MPAQHGCATPVWSPRAGRRGANGRLPVSYSRKVFIPVTDLCRDPCHYCMFVTVPGKLRAPGMGMLMEPDEILDVARRGAELVARKRCSPSVTVPSRRWTGRDSGSTNGAIDPHWTTSVR